MRHIALLILLLATGCAERWTRPGVSEGQADAANAQCGHQAAMAVPPAMIRRLAAPARVERHRDCRRNGYREYCTVTERFIPERWEDVDMNANARDGWRRQCMVSQGFAFQGYRPLRVE
jgi:hypothetical protein